MSYTREWKRMFGSVLTILVLGAFSAPLQGQTAPGMSDRTPGKWGVTAGAGVGLPAGDLADLNDPGFTTGLDLTYQVHPRIALRAGGDVEFLPAADELAAVGQGSDLDLWHYDAGAEIALLPRGRSPWSLTLDLGLGASTLDFEEAESTETYLSTRGGLKVGYGVTPMLDVYLGGDAHLMFADDEEVGFDTGWTVPVSAGVRVRLP